MGIEDFEVVGDTMYDISLMGVIEPETVLPCPRFLMNIKAIIRRVPHDLDEEDDDVSLMLEEEDWSVEENKATILVESDNMAAALSQTLSQLHFPLHSDPSMVDKIMFQVLDVTKDYYFQNAPPNHKIMHMAVEIDLYADDFGGTDVMEGSGLIDGLSHCGL